MQYLSTSPTSKVMALPIKLRLKRNETDRGVLMIYSPRLINKHYEKLIWQSLPPMKRTRKEAEAVAFFGSPVP